MATAQAPGRIPDQPCADCLDHSLVAERRRLAVPRQVAFWLLAFVFTATMLGTTLPTPLYVIYQAQWHFSPAVVTVIFAVYAAGVMAALLLAGRASDQAGRKPVLHESSHAVQGGVVFLMLASGTVTQLLLARFSSRRVVLAGLGLFLAALALIVAALAQAGMALFLAGTVVGGVAVGAIFLGSLATANRLAPPGRRGQTISTFFVLCYAGLMVPVVGVGVASGFIGDFAAVLALSILLAALSMFSLASIRRALLVPAPGAVRCVPSRRDPCWPVAELAASRDGMWTHMHHRGSQARPGWRANAAARASSHDPARAMRVLVRHELTQVSGPLDKRRRRCHQRPS
jgi:MFS family permease